LKQLAVEDETVRSSRQPSDNEASHLSALQASGGTRPYEKHDGAL
jgi:hypothetical protein